MLETKDPLNFIFFLLTRIIPTWIHTVWNYGASIWTVTEVVRKLSQKLNIENYPLHAMFPEMDVYLNEKI